MAAMTQILEIIFIIRYSLVLIQGEILFMITKLHFLF